MSCGGMSKSKILERFLGFGVGYVHRMTPNGVETASVPPYSPALWNRVRFFWASSGERSNTHVAFQESPCGKLVWALWLINQTLRSPSETSAQDGWSALRLYQITAQVLSLRKPFHSHPTSSSTLFLSFILHKPSFHMNADRAPLSGAKVTFTLKRTLKGFNLIQNGTTKDGELHFQVTEFEQILLNGCQRNAQHNWMEAD